GSEGLDGSRWRVGARRHGGGELEAVRATVLEAAAVPTVWPLGSVPSYPLLGLPPSLGDGFVGRADELWRIHTALSTMRGDVVTAAADTGALQGGGGFGQTRLALEHLRRVWPQNSLGGLFWIHAEVEGQLAE